MTQENKKNLIPHNFGRHGELILKPATLPNSAKKIEEGASLVVAHSETGHNHVITAEKGDLVMLYEHEGKTYLVLPSQGTLTHQKTVEKHDTQVFEAGTYERIIRHSYSYAEKVMRRVID